MIYKPMPKLPEMNQTVFFGKLFQIRNQIHLAHLKVTNEGSYAKHIALGDFYSSLLDLTDSLIESYQGKYGIQHISIPESKYEDPTKVISELAKLTEGSAFNTFKESWIKNQLDEISTLCYQTLYKLNNLR